MKLSYPIYIENDFNRLSEAVGAAGLTGYPLSTTRADTTRRKACIVTDSHVAPLYAKAVSDALSSAGLAVSSIQFEAGEAQKHLGTVNHFYDAFLANRLDRTSVVVALGGGVAGDMAGFAAATFMRGLPFVQIPTTLLAQVDAGVGGKTAVDHRGVKNLVGAFYQPALVYANLATLRTLSAEDFASGLGEVIKHGLIDGDAYRRYLHVHKAAILARDAEALREVVAGSCRIKAAVVAADEKERIAGGREVLNLGHTFGHAVESLLDYTLPHGCCVGIGLCAALYVSQKIAAKDGALLAALLRETEEWLTYFGLPTRAPVLSAEAVYQAMRTDKKVRDGTLRLVLADARGNIYTEDNAPERFVREAIDYMVGTSL